MHPSVVFHMTLADYRRYRRAYRAMVACGCDHEQTLAALGHGYVQTLDHRRETAIQTSRRDADRRYMLTEAR